MSKKTTTKKPIKLPDHYQRLSTGDIEYIMSDFAPYKEITLNECREILDKALGDMDFSDMIVQMRDEARY